MIPSTFEEWKYCIEHDCRIPLTKEFARKRLEVYQDESNPETKKFASLYGEHHVYNIKNWLNKIINE